MPESAVLDQVATSPAPPFAVATAVAPRESARARWAGRVMSGLVVAMLLLDAVMKFVKPEPVVTGTVES